MRSGESLDMVLLINIFLFALFFLSLGYVLSSRRHRGGSLLYFQSGEDMGREEG